MLSKDITTTKLLWPSNTKRAAPISQDNLCHIYFHITVKLVWSYETFSRYGWTQFINTNSGGRYWLTMLLHCGINHQLLWTRGYYITCMYYISCSAVGSILEEWSLRFLRGKSYADLCDKRRWISTSIF